MSQQEAEQSGALSDVMGPEPVMISGPGAELHFHFPIEVVVAGDIAEEVRQDLVSGVYEALHEALS